ncbi:YgjV family protein [Pseudoalteromonas denitrificans]|jgi:hypothetical protein|uniref:Inner membrane protein n=1 Tax=Pseudoalteromonas denitrificans DSM 6059 TaxID=1123010 RepID=A0A1I1E7V8_9GAMM|nr:YgjV family protein [Pseudoalteromonas denitrificans]SFB82722.1 inner membrane protein [Pseudoalteromonas denitrificans DSM 6059]
MSWDYLGYLASVFLVMSLMMTDVIKLRWFNLVGCLTFAIYGVVIMAWPVALTNAVLSLVNAYQIVKLNRANTELAASC